MNSRLCSANITSLKNLKDTDLLSMTKSLVQKERELTTQVLRHLQEIERRKLYCDLKYGSLFDYAIGELKYSEAAAARRIQAMRLMTEIPEVESKIESGVLNLSNICQAQSFFREQKKLEPERPLDKAEKQKILEKLEEKSAREGQRILLEMGGENILPRERERIVSPEHTEIRFIADQELKNKLEEVRSLLGSRGTQMNFAELVAEMAKLSAERLSEKKFGKKRTQAQMVEIPNDLAIRSDVGVEIQALAPRTRYIPQAVKHRVWQMAEGKCICCGSQSNLQFDHVLPFALGGASRLENLQLLCRSCNLRRGIQSFGPHAMKRAELEQDRK